MVKLPMQAPRRSLRQGDRSPATCRLLAPLKTKLTRIPSIYLVLPHTFLIHFVHLVHLVAFSYTRPFLVVVFQQRYVKNVRINIIIGSAVSRLFIVGGAWVVTAVELENGTGGHQNMAV